MYRVYDVSEAALKFSPICIRHRVCASTGKKHSKLIIFEGHDVRCSFLWLRTSSAHSAVVYIATLQIIDFSCGEMYSVKCSLIVNFLRVKIICHSLAGNQ
jgi:hypothetical protein